MDEVTKLQLILSVISTVLGSTVLNGILTHILYSRKLKKDKGVKFENMIGEKIAEALLSVARLTKKAKGIEIYDINSELETGSLDVFNGNTIYPEIMNDVESLNMFMGAISTCRNEQEEYLDCAIALQVVFIDRYITELRVFAGRYGTQQIYPVLGTVIIFDLQKWHKKCDKMLIRRLNKTKCRLEYHGGVKWKILRKWIVERQWKQSWLYQLKNGASKKKNEPMVHMIEKVLNNVYEDPESFD